VRERRALVGWMLYDWANSAFALTVLTAFFPIFFKKFWCVGFDPSFSTVRLNFANAVAGLCIALAAPLLGALADAGHSRKRFLMWFMMTGVLATGLLSSVPQGAWLLALVVFVIAAIGFDSANLFYDALLPVVAARERMDRVSSGGYAVGYLGCALLFVLNVVMVTQPQLLGLGDRVTATKLSFLSAAAWWLVFSLPLLVWVKEEGSDAPRRAREIIGAGLRQLKTTFDDIRGHRTLWLFLVAYWLYIDGVHTFIRAAADLGLSIGIDEKGLLLSLLLVQIVAFPAAYAFGLFAERFGTRRSLFAGICIYGFVALIGPLVVKTPLQFAFFAGLQAIPLGALQALSRSYYARMIPAEKSAEYFGFYSLMGKLAAVFGPAMVALVALTVRSSGGTAASAARWGCASLALLFVGGGVMLALSAWSPRSS
jgi:MFS transporter, UMF1 family